MTSSPRILLVGATGYLGLHLVKQLLQANCNFIALARNKSKLLNSGVAEERIIEAQVTDPSSLTGVCNNIDMVISCLGITRQRDGLTYQDVDYQANMNLLLEAEKAAVSKFIYVSAFNAQKYNQVRMLCAKERFSQRLLASDKLLPCIIRPNGFFSDLEEIYHMATKGKVYLFGRGAMRMNPIHGEDLAKYCIAAMTQQQCELDIGGPETLSVYQLAQLAFQAQHKQPVIVTVPDGVRRMILAVMKRLPEKWGGAAEFFLTVMGADSVAPEYGQRKIAEHYAKMMMNDS